MLFIIVGLTSVTIPESVTSLGKYCFRECSDIEKLTYNAIDASSSNFLVSSNTVALPFSNCEIKELIIGENVKTIPNYIFMKQGSITKIALPERLEKIGKQSFDRVGIEEITIPSSVTQIANFAFNKCENLKKITINKAEGSLEGAPWGAISEPEIVWNP